MKIYKLTIVFLIVDLIIISLLFTLYGPFKENMIVKLSDNKIAYSLWDEKDIWENMVSYNTEYSVSEEMVSVFDEDENKDVELNEYEKAILTKGDNEYYKLINLKIDGFNAYLAVIYDPSKVKLIHSAKFNTGNSQETILNMCKRYKGTVCINGGRFVDYGSGSDTPVGYIIKDGKVIWPANGKDTTKAKIIGITYDNELVLMNTTAKDAIKKGVRDALEFGPFLIVNGEDAKITNYKIGGYLGASRVAIGQRKDGIILFLVGDGAHGNGVTVASVRETLRKYGAYNAANLDGGASSQLVINNKLINKPKNILGELLTSGRRVVSGFGMILE